MSTLKKQVLHGTVAVVIAVIISLIAPPEGLTVAAMHFAGVFVAVVYLLLVNVFPDYLVGIVGLCAVSITQAAPFAETWGSFSSSTFLLIAAALGLGAAVISSGLLNRVALWILRLFPNTYFGRVLSLLIVGLIVGPAIPAASAKAALAGPLAKSVSDMLGFPQRSKGASGLFAAAYMSMCVLCLAFLSGSAYSLLVMGMMSEDAAASVTWLSWLWYSLPWLVIVLVLSLVFIMIVYKPEKVDSDGNPNYLKEKLAELGKPSGAEVKSGIILVICIVLWITKSLHGIPEAVVALAGFAAMFVFGVLKKGDMRTKVPWETVLFIGSILGFASLITSTGWSEWLSVILGSAIAPIISNVYVYVIVLAVVAILARFVVISQTATLALFFVVMTPIAATFGITEFVTGFVVSSACMVWNSNYQNATWITAHASAGGEEFVTYKSQLKMSIGFSVITIIACTASVPFWQMIGLC